MALPPLINAETPAPAAGAFHLPDAGSPPELPSLFPAGQLPEHLTGENLPALVDPAAAAEPIRCSVCHKPSTNTMAERYRPENYAHPESIPIRWHRADLAWANHLDQRKRALYCSQRFRFGTGSGGLLFC